MTDQEKAEERARKLLALVKRGVGGEAVNADKLLQRLLRRTGIKLEDIDDERLLRREFEYTTRQHKLFVLQCIASVIGAKGRSYTTVKGKRRRLYCDLNTQEHLEIHLRLDHYWRLLQRELDAFYDAFIQANRLFAKRQEGEEREPPKLSAEELAKLRRTMELMSVAGVEGPHLRLERPEKLNA